MRTKKRLEIGMSEMHNKREERIKTCSVAWKRGGGRGQVGDCMLHTK